MCCRNAEFRLKQAIKPACDGSRYFCIMTSSDVTGNTDVGIEAQSCSPSGSSTEDICQVLRGLHCAG